MLTRKPRELFAFTWSLAFLAGGFAVNAEAGLTEIQKMKNAACNVDGFLQNGDPDTMQMVENSNCYLLARSVDFWGTTPNFPKVAADLAALKKAAPNKSFVFGTFIPEAIPDTAQPWINAAGVASAPVDFPSFCVPGTQGRFGAGTCTGDITNGAYQSYLTTLEKQFLALGITVFQFGQVQLMDAGLAASGLFTNMRSVGTAAGYTIFISAQTAGITDGAYLKNFDFIVGGSYMNRFGAILTEGQVSGIGAETTGSALLWAEPFRSAANNVFIETDWWNVDDDVHRFAELSQADRSRVVASLYNYFASIGVAYVIPFFVPIVNGPTIASTCTGIQSNTFSASDCGNADDFNTMLANGPKPSSTLSLAENALVLKPGDYLGNGYKTAGATELIMQSDGNLVLYPYSSTAPNNQGPALWNSKTGGQQCQDCFAKFQTDGNVVLYNGSGLPYWSTATNNHPGAELALSATVPYLLVIDPVQDILWTSSNSFVNFTLLQNTYIQMGNTKITMQGDGNLVVSEGQNTLWTSGSTTTECGANGCYDVFAGAGGNMTIKVGTDNFWSTKTNGNSGSLLTVSATSPFMKIIGAGGQVLWEATGN